MVHPEWPEFAILAGVAALWLMVLRRVLVALQAMRGRRHV